MVVQFKIKITEENTYQDILNFLDKLGFVWNTNKKLFEHIPEKNPKWICLYISAGDNLLKFIKYSASEESDSGIYELNIIEEIGSILSEIEDTYMRAKIQFSNLTDYRLWNMALDYISNKLFIDSSLCVENFISSY